MKVTTDILWDYLCPVSEDAKTYNCIKRKASFTSVRQHPNKEHIFIENAIYVVGYEKYHLMNEQQERFSSNTFIFVNEKEDPVFNPDACCLNAFVIMNESIMDIFTRVSDICVDFNAWAEKLNDALIRNAELKELVNIGEEYIINPYIVLDEALNLLSFTDNINADDDTFQATIELGFTPPDLIATIIEKRSATKNFEKESIYKDESIVPYEEVNMPVLVNGAVVAAICVHCTIVNQSEGATDVLRYFAEKLSFYFKRNKVEKESGTSENKLASQFLHYLLRHDLDEQETRLMSESAEYPFRGKFHLYVLQPKTETPITYTLNRTAEYLPNETCFSYDEKIVVVSVFVWKNTSAEEHISNLEKRLQQLMRENNCSCGTAREFETLSGLKDAFIQACAALRLGKMLAEKKGGINDFEWRRKEKDRVFFYDDLSLYHMLEECSKVLSLKSMCMPQLIEMLEHDFQKDTDNYKILYTYLENDRVTSTVASLLHMHRNNVNYRIKRIEELFNIDLSDHDECIRILMSFRMLDLLTKEDI